MATASPQVNDLQGKYTSLQLIVDQVGVLFFSRVERGNQVVGRAPTDSDVTSELEKRTQGYNAGDWSQLAADLEMITGSDFPDAIIFKLKQEIYRQFPAVAKAINANYDRRRQAATRTLENAA